MFLIDKKYRSNLTVNGIQKRYYQIEINKKKYPMFLMQNEQIE